MTDKQDTQDAQDIEQFTDRLVRALDEQATQKKYAANPFFVSKRWFFLAVFSVIVHIVLTGIVFWQHMRIDYLVTKIIG
jgi:cytochrome b subunit of formate dehydrogenase